MPVLNFRFKNVATLRAGGVTSGRISQGVNLPGGMSTGRYLVESRAFCPNGGQQQGGQ